MDTSPLNVPPPIPSKNRLWIILTVVGLVAILALGAVAMVGYSVYEKNLRKRAAERAALAEMDETRNKVSSELAELVESGEVEGSGELVGKLKDQMEKSAANLDPTEAAALRGMAAFMGRMQRELGVYEKISREIDEEGVFSFNVTERAKLQKHREMIRAFQDSNSKLTELVTNSEDIVREALVEAKVPRLARDAALKQFQTTQAQVKPLQLQIRKADSALCDTSFSILDLLEKNWGKWRTEAETGNLVFDDDATLAAFQELQEKIMVIAQEQATAQEKLVEKMRTMRR
jgi:hypothetical protein